jgi:hypothetical protein
MLVDSRLLPCSYSKYAIVLVVLEAKDGVRKVKLDYINQLELLISDFNDPK